MKLIQVNQRETLKIHIGKMEKYILVPLCLLVSSIAKHFPKHFA